MSNKNRVQPPFDLGSHLIALDDKSIIYTCIVVSVPKDLYRINYKIHFTRWGV